QQTEQQGVERGHVGHIADDQRSDRGGSFVDNGRHACDEERLSPDVTIAGLPHAPRHALHGAWISSGYTMRILLFGKNGQLGWELQRSLAPLGEVIALGTNDQPCADFSRPSDVAATVSALAPDVIVNAAAYTAVDKAESDALAAMTVN